MTRAREAAGDAEARRRALLVVLRADRAGVARDLADRLRDAAGVGRLDDVDVAAFESTGGYRPDPRRPQAHVPADGAVQIDYRADRQNDVAACIGQLDQGRSSGDIVLAAGRVVTCIEPGVGEYLLLLGAQRKPGLTPDEFGRYWAEHHAPHATRDLRAAPVHIGYELFLVDHELTASMASDPFPAGRVDGWMHMITPGPSDLAGVIRDPEHSAWVLEDEAHFVDFAAPLVGQQMRRTPPAPPTP